MKVHKYETLYPRSLWIVNCNGEDPTMLTKKYIFYKNLPGWKEVYSDIDKELISAEDSTIAACYVVEERSTGNLGLLLVIFRIEDLDTATVAHESVHVADYFYEVCGCDTGDFTDGNEAYAYLVEWAAGCIANVLIKERQ